MSHDVCRVGLYTPNCRPAIQPVVDDKPTRRWFQFRLSTVLVRTAIAAWGMALPAHVPGHFELSEFWPIPKGRPIELQLNRDLVWLALALAAFLT